ncbi:hypothetical protein [Actinoplanes subglobosus]|uniref:Uncharacterized protein n=1 Tax=Actinoplanes subglobosus TaxID=1547892 RepID=A0ABV8J214_9ACTN
MTNFGLLSLHDQPPSKRPAGWKLFGGVTAAVLALCCGGFLGLGLLVDEPGTNRAAATASEEAGNPALPVVRGTSVTTEITSSPKAGAVVTPSSAPPSASPVPTRTTTKPAPLKTTSKPAPKPVVPKTSTPKTPTPTSDPTRLGITPGAFCSPEGAYGIGRKNGRLYRCRSVDGDQARWKRVRS